MNIANEVSSMESEIQSLRSENDVLKHNKAVIEWENESLRRAVAKANAERDNYMRRAETIKALLDQTGAGLVSGMNKYHESERELQARQLEVEDNGEMPRFLLNGNAKRGEERAHE